MNVQKQIFNSYLQGKNIFMTGPGGTGKSYIIKKIYEDALEKNIKVKCTALTGVAALLLNCDASTLHAWSGIGLCKKNIEEIIKHVINSKYRSFNWLNTDLLIIDEISMMSKKMFEILDNIGKKVRNNDKPFGGIQIIMSGDFFQLPPVENNDSNYYFCFESKSFINSFDCIYSLKTIYRQSGDSLFKKMLKNLRIGLISKNSLKVLNDKVIGNNIYNLPEEIIKIVPKKKQSDEINKYYLDNIKSKVFKYRRSFVKIKQDKISSENIKKRSLLSESERDQELKYLKDSTLTNEVTELKKGAYVMLIANISPEEGLVNGSCGKVIDFTDDHLPVVEFRLPISEKNISKSNKIENTSESNKSNGNGENSEKSKNSEIGANGENSKIGESENEEKNINSENKNYIKIEKVIGFHCWNSETLPDIALKQLPLILAWSITIHKCQGLTLDKAIIDASNNIFEAGQLYVALSRVKNLEGLSLMNFDINSLKIHSSVIKFYKENNLL